LLLKLLEVSSLMTFSQCLGSVDYKEVCIGILYIYDNLNMKFPAHVPAPPRWVGQHPVPITCCPAAADVSVRERICTCSKKSLFDNCAGTVHLFFQHVAIAMMDVR
jgi:hypothetical protein